MSNSEIFQLAILFATVFAAWRLDSISRTLGEVTTNITHLKEGFSELKEGFTDISNRIDKVEKDIQDGIKIKEESNV